MVRNRAQRFGCTVLLLVTAVLVTGSAGAAPSLPLYGPKSYTKTSSVGPDHFSDTFFVPLGGTAVVWIQNGDGEGNRTNNASIAVNGTTIATASDFSRPIDLIAKAVLLPKGTASVAIEASGVPGSVITIVVMVQGTRPDVTVGRLVVAYASATGLTLALNNGAGQLREVNVAFYDAGGYLVATSDRFILPPHGSVSKAPADLITEGGFTAGSIEVFWVGYGPGRLFGQATVHDDLTGVDSITEMQQAGTKRIDPQDLSLKVAH